jgi:hypothetical protein
MCDTFGSAITVPSPSTSMDIPIDHGNASFLNFTPESRCRFAARSTGRSQRELRPVHPVKIASGANVAYASIAAIRNLSLGRLQLPGSQSIDLATRPKLRNWVAGTIAVPTVTGLRRNASTREGARDEGREPFMIDATYVITQTIVEIIVRNENFA